MASLSGAFASTTPATAAVDDKVTFTVALTGDVDSFSPWLGVNAESYEMWALTYDYMIGYSMEDMSPAPALATEWDTSEDGLTWSFTIQEGVDWSDGEPLTANDIAYTYNRIVDGGVEGNNWGSYLNNVSSVTAPDDTTLVLQLDKPNATLPLLPIPILPEHTWTDVDEKEAKTFAAEPGDGPVVGSGPFRLTEGTAGGSTYRFEANPDYWGGAPYVDQVVFQVYKNNDSAVQALIKGEVDFVEGITPLQVKALEDEEGVTAQNGVSPLFDEIGFNVGARDPETEEPLGDGNPALQDPDFRYAVAHAVDIDRLVESAYQGAALPGTTIVPSAYGKWHYEVPDDQKIPYDPDKAKELLDAAGYTVGDDGFRTQPDGTPIGKLRLFARSEAKTSTDTMDFFQQWLADVDIDSEVTAMDSNSLYEEILDGTYDAFQWNWYVEPDPDGILADFTCAQRGGLSDSWYCDEEYDAMYAAQNQELDDEKRAEIVKDMQEKLYLEAPYIVTTYSVIGEAVRNDKFACFQPQPDPGGVWLVQYGARNYTLLRPADEAGDCDGVTTALGASTTSGAGADDDGGSSTALLVAGGVVLVGLVAGGVVLMRRRGTATDRE